MRGAEPHAVPGPRPCERHCGGYLIRAASQQDPGLEEYLTPVHLDHAFIAGQESTVVTVPGADTTPPGGTLPDLGAIFGS